MSTNRAYILWCGAAPGYKDTTNAIKQHCRGVVKRHLTDKLGREQETSIVNESSLDLIYGYTGNGPFG